MTHTVLYRLPHASRYTLLRQHAGTPETGHSLAWLNGRSGFVVAPFAPSAECPVVLLHPDEEATFDVPQHTESPLRMLAADGASDAERSRYAATFARFHAQLTAGTFGKLVLARAHSVRLAPAGGSPLSADVQRALFLHACALYPRQYVALFSTPQSGTWLVATPEVLLEGTGRNYSTMALAGTAAIGEGASEADIVWSAKNRQEQHLVEQYVEQCISRYADTVSRRDCHTVRAGRLAHLCTDFRFTLTPDGEAGDLLAALHPTPAVCGLPKAEAQTFILSNEAASRLYYSGFSGPLSHHGHTHLYVTLRCMSLHADHCTLYAGGGLLKGSTEQREWDETEAKMGTMRRLLAAPIMPTP